MKKTSRVLALVLTFILAFGTASAFANTYDGVAENKAEETTYTFTKDVVAGKYKLVDTQELKSWVDSGKVMTVVDTMPASSYTTANGHVPGAINAVCGNGSGGAAYEWVTGQKTDLLNAVKADLISKGKTKKVYTYTSWVKTTKTKYKKITNKNLKKVKKVKGKYVYYKRSIKKTTTVADKSAPVVVYCGFIGCARSHIAAAYLTSQGYTNVYRYGGGILAWKDAGYEAVTGDTPFAPEPQEPEQGEVTKGAVKSGDFTIAMDLSKGTYSQDGNKAKIWVPIPEDDAYQTITGYEYDAPNATVAKETRDSADNKVLYLEFAADVPAADRTATIKYHVERAAIESTTMVEKGEVPADIKAAYIDATFETMGDAADQAKIKEIAEKIVADANATTIKDKAYAIFDWEVNNLYRRQGAGDNGEIDEGFSFSGCGRGEVVQVLTRTFGGKCTDLNSTYVALCRSVGVPAREKFGCRLNANSNGAQHCRAEFYLPGTGWVEADPGDALKTLRGKGLVYGVKTIADMDPADVAAAKAAYFGANDNNWVKLAGGRDITLDPAQKAQCPEQKTWERCVLNPSGTLNNMGYVYGEMEDAEGNATYMNAYSESSFGYNMSFAQ